ncbi:Alpha/Beta hydrolase protein [Fimicolochytrium jonesii]|uniref:Alpha/Beta hydrolase protein n=1 Tax=Fimicolochytrium jonesii TaxID=1396493 RepID=UPI0022FDDBC9|nr:Alpha/Beta hydrolase protein [Fimicolochytrium jonesii]KAI8819813.1 Alpha/Beta hydrolase protein [Fimicolochytrium jonesii]
MTFEDQGAEWRKGKQAERYPTVLPENAKKWDAASRVYDLKGEWIEYDDKIPPPRDELFGFRRWAGSWIRRQPKEEPSQTPTPPPERERRDKVIYFLHGGAYIGGTTQLYRLLSGRLAKETNCKVFALDYRLAPEHAFPAALHDAFTGYLYMINPQHSYPKDIILMGDSAGGGLVMCLLNYLNLYLRSPTGQHLVPLPSGAALMSPWVDLAFTSESWSTNATFDWLPSNARQIHDHIVPGFIRDRVEQFVRHPLVSPIFAETYAGLPPILIQAGEAEVLRDDSLALAFKYDRDNVGRHGFKGWVRHEMFTDMVHIFVMMSWTKESTSAMQRINYFLDELEVGHPLEPICVEDDVTVDSHVSL